MRRIAQRVRQNVQHKTIRHQHRMFLTFCRYDFRHQQRANVVFVDGHLGSDLMVPGSLDPRLPAEAAEAFRLAMTGDAEGISEHLAGLSEEQLELIQTAARDLDAASCHELVRRHS